jgi:hypothetical protein
VHGRLECAGMRIATVSSPAVTSSGTLVRSPQDQRQRPRPETGRERARRRRERPVSAPAAAAVSCTWTMRGSADGRPLAEKTRRTAVPVKGMGTESVARFPSGMRPDPRRGGFRPRARFQTGPERRRQGAGRRSRRAIVPDSCAHRCPRCCPAATGDFGGADREGGELWCGATRRRLRRTCW